MLNFMKTPEHDLILSNGVKVKYRPFLVKEEKILLMSVENNEEQDMINTLIKTVQTCVLTDGIDVTKFLAPILYSLRFSRIIKNDGVTSNVIMVLKPKPQQILIPKT